MNHELLKQEAKTITLGIIDNWKKELKRSGGKKMAPFGAFYIHQEGTSTLQIAPIMNFYEFFTSHNAKSSMRPALIAIAREMRKIFLWTVYQKIFCFVMISEAWWYEQPGTNEIKILPKDHPKKQEGIMAKISFSDQEVVMIIAYLRGINTIAFETMAEMDMNADVTGTFANLFTV